MTNPLSTIFSRKSGHKLFNIDGWFDEEIEKIANSIMDQDTSKEGAQGDIIRLLILTNLELIRALSMMIHLITIFMERGIIDRKRGDNISTKVDNLMKEIRELKMEMRQIVKDKETKQGKIRKLLEILRKAARILGIGSDMTRLVSLSSIIW